MLKLCPCLEQFNTFWSRQCHLKMEEFIQHLLHLLPGLNQHYYSLLSWALKSIILRDERNNGNPLIRPCHFFGNED